MKNKMNLVFALVLSLVVLTTTILAAPVPVTVENVEVEGSEVSTWGTTVLDIKRGDEIAVDLELVATADVEDVEVVVTIKGYNHNDKETLTAEIKPFNLISGTRYRKSVDLEVPQRVEEGLYTLRVLVMNRNDDTIEETYDVRFDNDENEMTIRDVVFYPETGIEAGYSLRTNVRVKNYGQEDEESVKVEVSVPALGTSASTYMDEVEAGDSETSSQLNVKIPMNTKPGFYEALVKVSFDDGDESITDSFTFEVICEAAATGACSAEAVKENTLVSGDSVTKLTGNVGATLSFPFTITNVGSEAKTYTVTVTPVEGTTFKMSPANVIVAQPGETKIVYLYATSEEAGEKVFIANVKSDSDSNQVVFNATVEGEEEESKPGFMKGLEYGILVLLALLVILGLVVVFNKLTSSDDDEDEDDEAQTYY